MQARWSRSAGSRDLGPWATTLDTGFEFQLSTFWRRRVMMLPWAVRAGQKVSRPLVGLVVLLAIAAASIPSLDLAAPPEPPAAGSVRAELGQGMAVELLAVADDYKADARWWTPAGAPIEAPEIHGGMFMPASPGTKVRAFVVRYRGPRSELNWFFPTGGPGVGNFAQGDLGQLASMSQFGENATSGAIPLGLVSGDWETMASVDTAFDGYQSVSPVMQDGTQYQLLINSVVERAGHPALIFVDEHPWQFRATRGVAILKSSETIVARDDRSSGFGGWQLRQFEFPDVALKDVKAIEIQSRRYRWVEFRDVSLEPGQVTRPTAVVLDKPPDSAKVKIP